MSDIGLTVPFIRFGQHPIFFAQSQSSFSLEWAMVVAAALIAILPLLLPAGKRLLTRGPFVLLCASLVFLGLSNYISNYISNPNYYVARSAFFSIAFGLWLCSLGRSLFLIGTRSKATPIFIRTLPRIVLDTAQALMYAVIVLASIAQADLDVAWEEMAKWSAGIAAVIIFLGRDTIGNIIAGLAIQMQRPFEVLDWIQFDEHLYNIGKVLEINWRATRVITLDEVEVTIPNSMLAQVPIRNYTKPQRYSRRSIFVVTPYAVPTRLVQKIILDAVSDAWGVEKFPEPSVVSNDFNERGVEHWVRIFTKEFGKRDKVDGSVRDRIWYALHRNGIPIPGPLRHVDLKDISRESLAQDEAIRINDYKEALKRVDFLDELADEDFDALAKAVQRRYYAEGEIIVRQNEPGSELFIIHLGQVAASIQHGDGTVIELNRMGPEAFFGEVSLLTGEPRTATVTATQDSEIFVVDKEAFAPIMERSPGLAEHMSEVLTTRQAEVDSRLTQHKSTVEDDLTEKRRDLLEHIKEFFSI